MINDLNKHIKQMMIYMICVQSFHIHMEILEVNPYSHGLFFFRHPMVVTVVTSKPGDARAAEPKLTKCAARVSCAERRGLMSSPVAMPMTDPAGAWVIKCPH